MEFPFNITQLFSERISILDQTLIAGRKSAGRPDLQAHIATVIDELGRASAKAQQLTAPITSASKLQSQKHQLYLLKDGERNGGRGVIVGFLKVGYKKLFLLDLQGAHIEAEPLCVLDFYIAENLQRHGYGLELFDFMLQHKNLEPVLMAYDRPSPKFLSFLAKHYCLTQSVPQNIRCSQRSRLNLPMSLTRNDQIMELVNNFVVFEGFFLNRSEAQWRKAPLKKPDGEIKPYSLMEREAVRQEQRALPWPFAPPHYLRGSVSSQYSHSLSVGSSPSRVLPQAAPVSSPGSSRDQSPESPLINRCRARRTSQMQPLQSAHGQQSCSTTGHLSGVRPVRDQSFLLGYTDTQKLANIHTPQSRSPPFSLPPPSLSKKDDICNQASMDSTKMHSTTDAEALDAKEEVKVLDSPQHQPVDIPVNQRHLLERDSNGQGEDWSWTLGKNYHTAQWVKQKQKYRSTWPW